VAKSQAPARNRLPLSLNVTLIGQRL
jgi:hypothetical protein